MTKNYLASKNIPYLKKQVINIEDEKSATIIKEKPKYDYNDIENEEGEDDEDQ